MARHSIHLDAIKKIEVSDIQYLGEDKETRVFCFIMENGDDFMVFPVGKDVKIYNVGGGELNEKRNGENGSLGPEHGGSGCQGEGSGGNPIS